jgi:putative sterol carrier protein
LKDGSTPSAIGLLRTKETTISAFYDMGLDLIDSVLDLSFGKLDNDFKIPEIDHKISLSTYLEGEKITFNLFIDDEKINVIESKEEEGDIRISIKESYLSKLLKGNFNLPMALLTGKIKIENKAALFKLLAGLGLKF